ncbi:MAG: hypothetical protein HQK49_00685 [Oligoflexia bacterium]|nr:hypothetical protein [Oligoflexia bacterium]
MYSIKHFKLFSALLLSLSVSCFFLSFTVLAEKMDSKNNPELMRTAGKFANNPLTLNYDFETLPKQSELENKPWPENYWPTVKGGLRYSPSLDRTYNKFDLLTHNVFTMKFLMSQEKINKLPPTMKLDLYLGDYSYSLTREEIERTDSVFKNPEGKGWFGLCHGWASRALNCKEPKPVTVKNPNGISIQFNSSDLKALDLYFEGEVSNGEDCGAGRRCNIESDKITGDELEYKDVHIATFYLALTNLIPQGQGFVMDKTIDAPVWNQPIFGYSTKVISDKKEASQDSAVGTVREVEIELTVDWLGELSSREQPYGDDSSARHKVVYTGVLELDKDNKIIGGKWTGNSVKDHPDFIWMKADDDKAKYGKRWQALKELLEKAQQ